jgi:hypothetical protein
VIEPVSKLILEVLFSVCSVFSVVKILATDN